MKLKQIVLKNFMNYTNAEINFPDNGIILVTGENGAGKSSAFIDSMMAFVPSTLPPPVWSESNLVAIRPKAACQNARWGA